MNTEIIKKQAKLAGAYLQSKGIELSHSNCLHLIACINGFKNWQTLKPTLKNNEIK
jgi:hypothetical protein